MKKLLLIALVLFIPFYGHCQKTFSQHQPEVDADMYRRVLIKHDQDYKQDIAVKYQNIQAAINSYAEIVKQINDKEIRHSYATTLYKFVDKLSEGDYDVSDNGTYKNLMKWLHDNASNAREIVYRQNP